MADNENELGGGDTSTPQDKNRFRPGRRELIKVGALLVPTIVTLHATPAWAQNKYEMVAYRYGVNQGLCRNPQYRADAPPTSRNSQEFIECPPGRGGDHDSSGGQQAGPGPIDF